MTFYRIGDEMVARENMVSIGDVKPVKVSIGKGKDLIERVVFNFYVKCGLQVFKTRDFDTAAEAENFRAQILEGRQE